MPSAAKILAHSLFAAFCVTAYSCPIERTWELEGFLKESVRRQDVGAFKQGHVIAWQSLEDDRPLFLQECVAVIERENAWFLLRAYRHPREEKGRGWRLLIVDDAPLQPFAEYPSKPSKAELMAFIQRSWWHFGERHGMKVIESGICESVLKRIFDMS
jgi:hypothetical protein